MSLKNLATIAILAVGSLGADPAPVNLDANSPIVREVYVEEKSLGDVLKYLEANPNYRELVINYSINFHKKANGTFSKDTLDNLAGIVLEAAKENPQIMKDFVLDISAVGLRSSYRQQVWQQLSPEEKWDLFTEMSYFKTKECWEETLDVAKDAYSKFSETKLYDKIKFGRDKTAEMIKDRARSLREKIPGIRRMIKESDSGDKENDK